VAIVPLAANAFNEAKSDLKGLEALALGVPFVASPTGPYRALADHSRDAGWLAASPGGWREQIAVLVSDQDWRGDLIGKGRAYVAEYRTVEGQAWRWLEAWGHAVKHCLSRQGRTPSHAV
jgi:glycosyltransferase involved in cell wall biosynthesis